MRDDITHTVVWPSETEIIVPVNAGPNSDVDGHVLLQESSVLDGCIRSHIDR